MTRYDFGTVVRNVRQKRKIGLREMAKMIGVSPTYLSKVERGECGPPAEDKVRKMAVIINQDPDYILSLAGRVSADLQEIIRRYPIDTAKMLRAFAKRKKGA